MARSTFRRKAIAFFVPTIIGTAAVCTWTAYVHGRDSLRAQLFERCETVAGVVARNAEIALLSRNAEFLRRAVTPLAGVRDVERLVVYDQEGRLVASSGEEIFPVASTPPLGQDPTRIDAATYVQVVLPVFTTASDEIGLFEPTVEPSPKAMIGWVDVRMSKSVLREAERELVRHELVVGSLCALGGSLVFCLLLSYATRSLRLLTSAVQALREGRCPELVPVRSRDDIGELAEEFRRMSEVIREREASLIASQERLTSLFERVEHGIFRLDAAWQVVEANRRFVEIFGEDRAGGTLLCSEEWKEKALAGKVRESEIAITDVAGGERSVVVSVYPVMNGGELQGFDGYVVDVTERKRLEDALAQVQKLECVGLLAGGVAHDFNNLLSGILINAGLIKSQAFKNQPSFAEIAERIERSALRGRTLTQQLLGFARKGNYKVEPLSLAALADEVGLLVRETFPRTVSFQASVRPGLPTILADASQIYHALMNLCINARDAMPDGGELCLGIERVGLPAGAHPVIPAGDYVRVRVRDTGVGMTPDVQKRIFEPFFTTKEVGKGTGMGLPMVYGIVQSHRGHIDVRSEPGKGTEISLFFPVHEETPVVAPLPTAAAGRPLRGAGTILVVEDEEEIRRGMKYMLEAAGYAVHLAKDGAEGIDLFRRLEPPPDLVILDMNMPVLDGRAALRVMRAERPDARILVCSGYGDDGELAEVFQVGAFGPLRKPFLPEELVDQVRDCLAGGGLEGGEKMVGNV